MKTEKSGLAIGYLTDGMLNVNWLKRVDDELPNGIPGGIFWKKIWVQGKDYSTKGGYAKARAEVVKKARELNSKWLFFFGHGCISSY